MRTEAKEKGKNSASTFIEKKEAAPEFELCVISLELFSVQLFVKSCLVSHNRGG
jgi:hypothetical protein